MRVITVIPIAKGIFRQELSYFTSKNVSPGMLVSIPVRKKTAPALVIASQEIKKIKSGLKRADFSLKSIKDTGAKNFLRPEFLEACREIADYFVSPVGAVIKDFIPQAILSLASDFGGLKIPAETYHETIVLQQQKEERIRSYKSIVREEFARNHSVFLCVPSSSDLEEVAGEIKKGIEKYSVILNGEIPAKKILGLWRFALEEKHPILIIATRLFLGLPRNDLGTLIIERSGSSFYKLRSRPYLDIKKSAEIIASKLKIRLVLSDNVIRSEDFFKNKLANSQRILTQAEQILVDLKKDAGKEKAFQNISPELENILKESDLKNGHSILFASRRGHSPLVICQECQRTVLCKKCDAPLVLHEGEGTGKNKFICHKCLAESPVAARCPYCQSWQLRSFGAGVQKIKEEIAKKIDKTKIFCLDSDAVKTKKAGQQIAEKFLNTPGGILIGTEMIFSFVRRPVENSAAVVIDPLFALPDFRINEKIFQTLLCLRGLGKKNFLIQTRMADMEIFDYVFKGNVSGFYRTELEKRERLGYPPFKTIIKISREGRNLEIIKKEIKQMEQKLAKWNPMSYPAFIGKIKGTHIWHIIMKLEPDTWPEQQKELQEILFSLSPSWKVNVDPESLL